MSERGLAGLREEIDPDTFGETVGSLWEPDWASKKQDQARGLLQSFFQGCGSLRNAPQGFEPVGPSHKRA